MTEESKQHESTENQDPDWLKEVRRKADAYDKVVPQMQREFAALKLGIDTEDPVYDLFSKNAEVDWNDLDAVKESASKYRLIKPAEEEDNGDGQGQLQGGAGSPTAPANYTQEDIRTHQSMANAARGGQTPPASPAETIGEVGSFEEWVAQFEAAGGVVDHG